MTDKQIIRSVAHEIRRVFVTMKQAALQQPTYKLNPRMDRMEELWEKSALLCIELAAPPQVFVKACFDAFKSPQGPFPNMMAGPWATKAFQRFGKIEKQPIPDNKIGVSVTLNKLYGSSYEHDMALTWDHINHRLRHTLDKDIPEERLKLFQDTTESISAWLRILAYPDDPEVWRQFAYIGVAELRKDPMLVESARRNRYPVDRVLLRAREDRSQIIQSRPSWVRDSVEYDKYWE